MLEYDPFIDDFFLLASDGLFDKFSSQEAVDYVRQKLMTMPYMGQDVQKVTKEIVKEAIYARHVGDNVTVILVALNRGIKQ